MAKEIGPIARPRRILVVAELPKTRSGKIMRRLLRDVAENREVGDATTLADGSVMDLISDQVAAGQAGLRSAGRTGQVPPLPFGYSLGWLVPGAPIRTVSSCRRTCPAPTSGAPPPSASRSGPNKGAVAGSIPSAQRPRAGKTHWYRRGRVAALQATSTRRRPLVTQARARPSSSAAGWTCS